MARVALLVVAAFNGLAVVGGTVAWWRWSPGPWAWRLVRAGQLAAGAMAVLAGILALAGLEPRDGLFWLYAVLPVAIAFLAEQLRILSAETILDQRGLEDAKAVGDLEEDEQRWVVLAILRRELGVMAVAAGVVVFLVVRALAEL